jgi:hypothetical protein
MDISYHIVGLLWRFIYLWFSACYVDENTTVQFSETIPMDGFSKMST